MAALVEPAHDAAGGVEPEGAAAGEHDRVDLLDEILGAQQVGLAGAGGGAAHVDAAGRAGFAEHDGAAGRPARVGVVAHAQAGDVGDRAVAAAAGVHAGCPPVGSARIRP